MTEPPAPPLDDDVEPFPPDHWRGALLVDVDEEEVAQVDEVFLDRETGVPEWALLTLGLLRPRPAFVPLADAKPLSGWRLQLPYRKSDIDDVPEIPARIVLTPEDEDILYAYWASVRARESGDA